nr:TPA_inf: conotoxin precursor Cerm11 [Conus judaeus]
MEFRRLVTVALLLALVLSVDSTPADQTETGRVSLREDDRFPCNSGQCACLSSFSYRCQSTTDSTADCLDNECKTEDEW